MMKKIFYVLVVLLLFSAVSCGKILQADVSETIADIATEELVQQAETVETTQAEETPTTQPTPTKDLEKYKIVFSMAGESENEDSEIFVVDVDGENLQQLTFNNVDDSDPEWSPDGKRILFVSDTKPQRPDLYIMNADGSDIQQLTKTEESEFQPAWSPDGNRIAFSSYIPPQILIINPNGENLQELTSSQDFNMQPDWSPDGLNIAYIATRNNEPKIFRMDADGGNRTQLSIGDSFDTHPAWSPNGETIVFSSVPNPDADADLYLMNEDGSDLQQITDMEGFEIYPAWSPDGEMLVFTSNMDGDADLYIMKRDGTEIEKILENDVHDREPSWSPIPLSPISVSAEVENSGETASSENGGEVSIFVGCEEPTMVSSQDSLRIYFSWLAKTEQQVRDFIDSAKFTNTLAGDQVTFQIQFEQISEIRKHEDGYVVTYSSGIGDLEPGEYLLETSLTFDRKISDGWDELGPGTDYKALSWNCEIISQ